MRQILNCSVLILSGMLLASCGSDEDASRSFCDTKLFTPAAESPYILPYLTGSTYTMFQGNCSPPPGGHRQTFAYDFDFGMGDPIYAARTGTVISVNDQYSDDDHTVGHENNVFVEHLDLTVARYTHLMQGGAEVTVGQVVMAGDLLGLAGNSGNSSGPHLHFQVFQGRNYNANNALPITFSNAVGNLGPNDDLLEGEAYTAGPVTWGYLERD
jgi:hypothetical protein